MFRLTASDYVIDFLFEKVKKVIDNISSQMFVTVIISGSRNWIKFRVKT